MIILKICKKIITYIFFSIIVLILVIQTPPVKNKLGELIIKKINENKSFTISIENFDLKRFTTLKFKNIEISANKISNKKIKIEEILLNINPFYLFLNKKLVLRKISISNINLEINTENYKNTYGNTNNNFETIINSKLKHFLEKINITLEDININNINIVVIDNKKKIENKIYAKIERLDFTNKSIFLKLDSIKINNKYFCIFDTSFSLRYYINTDSINISVSKLSSSLFHFIGNISVKNLKNIFDKGNIIKNLSYYLKIKKLIFTSDNIKKITSSDILKNIDKNIELQGEIKLHNEVLDIQNLLMKYNNEKITLKSQIHNFTDKNKFNYNIKIDNSKPLIFLLNNIPKYTSIAEIINKNIKNISISITGTNYTSAFYSKLETKIGNIDLNGDIRTDLLNNKYFLDKINKISLNISCNRIRHKSIQNVELNDTNINISYDIKTKKNTIYMSIKQIFYRNNDISDLIYKGELNKNLIIEGDMSCRSNIINLSGKNALNIPEQSFILDGNLTIFNRKINDFEINNINSDFTLNAKKNNTGIKIDSSLKNIKFTINNSEIKANNIENTILIHPDSVNINLKSNASTIDIKGLNIKYLLSDINSIYTNIKKNNKININHNNKYKTEIIIDFKKTEFLNIFFNKYLDIDYLYLHSLIEHNNKKLEYKTTINAKDIKINDHYLGEINLKQNIFLNDINSFPLKTYIKTILNKKTYTFESEHIYSQSSINNKIKLKKEDTEIVNSQLKIKKKENDYTIAFDNIKNYLKLFNNKIETFGTITFKKQNLTFNNLRIINVEKNKNIITVDADIFKTLFDKNNKINIMINDLQFNNINYKSCRNLNFLLNANIHDKKDNIFADIDIKNIKMNNVKYGNINITTILNKKDTELENTIDISVKYYNPSKTKVSINGKIFTLETKSYNLDIKINDIDLKKFNLLTRKILNIKNGKMYGNFIVKGDTKKINISGNGNIKDLSIYIKENGCSLENINADIFASDTNKIELYSISSFQNKNKCGDFTGEIIFKENLKPSFTLTGNFYNCNIFNKNKKHQVLSGNVFGDGEIRLEYLNNIFLINANIKPSKGKIFITQQQNNEQYRMFENKIEILKKFCNIKTKERIKTTLDFDIYLNKNIDIQIDINKFNQLKLNGEGNLSIKKDNTFKITGDYTIKKGSYNFNTFNIVSKNFKINKGYIFFNNEIQNTKINFEAISDKYEIVKDSKKKNTFLIVKLSGYLIHPDIEYGIIFENENSTEYENNDIKSLVEYFFSNSTNDIKLNETINEAINKIIIKNIRKINKNILVTFKSNILELFIKNKIKDISLNLLYRINDNFYIEKTFLTDEISSLYKNVQFTFNTNNNNVRNQIILFDTSNNKNVNKKQSSNIFTNNFNLRYSF